MDFRRPLSVVTSALDGDILAVLAGVEEEFSGRRLHRMLGRGSEAGARKAAERLVGQGVVTRRQAGRANLYSLNRNHLAARHIEGLATLRAQLLERLREAVGGWAPAPHTVVLFGSVARGEAGPTSDLDLLVVRPKRVSEDATEWREQLAALERDATAWTGNAAQILEYGELELGDREVKAVVQDAIADGIELSGSRRQLKRLVEEGGR